MDNLLPILASYVPDLIVRRLAQDPRPISEPAAEYFRSVVLFADVSGFTALAEDLAQMGPDGAEVLSRALNDYFGGIVDLVHAYGGDVVKFAGDALIAIWTDGAPGAGAPPVGSPGEQAQRATQCAVEIQNVLREFRSVEGIPLSIKISIGAGDVGIIHVGGEFSRWEFIVTGEPFEQVGVGEHLANPSDTILSPQVWLLVHGAFDGVPLRDGFVRLTSVRLEIPARPRLPAPLLPEMEGGLRSYIPGAILSRLRAGQSGWLAELRRVTVLFINLPDLNYDVLLETAQAVTRALQTRLYELEGSVNKITVDDKGTTLVAVLGLPPVVHEDDEVRGVLAGMNILETLDNLRWRSAIGIASGRVFCGSIGNARRREYTVMGDVVNLAARLMQAAALPENQAAGIKLLCDRATYEAASRELKFLHLPKINVKGKAQAILIYKPLGKNEEPEGYNYRAGATGKLVGRVEERARLVAHLQSLLRGGTGGLVIIEGEAGIGKSRLIAELLYETDNLQIRALYGSGDAIEKQTPYNAWRGVFRQFFGLDGLEASTITEMQAAVLRRLREIMPRPESDWLRYTPLLNAVVPLDWHDNEFTASLPNEVRAGNTHAFLVQILQQAVFGSGEKSPLVIVLEDGHWLDSASWALARQVAASVAPLLLVLSLRPLLEPHPADYRFLAEMPGSETIRLGALPSAESIALVCQRLNVPAVPESVERLIISKAEGHPFFCEELVYALRDSGLIQVANGECRVTTSDASLLSLHFPDTIEGVITSRIDALSPQQQMTLKVASVIGRIFGYQALSSVFPIEDDKPNLLGYLNALERLEITPLETKEPDLIYIFKHIITREVSYNLMLFSQRKQLHRAVAEYYEQRYAEDLSPYYPVLAYHWVRAEVRARAVHYLNLAGEQALQNQANREAAGFFDEACALAQEDTESWGALDHARWERLIGVAYLGMGDLGAAKEKFHSALKWLERPVPASSGGMALRLLGQLFVQVRHRLSPPKPARTGALALRRYQEIALNYDGLAEVHYFDTETLPILNTTLSLLNYGEKAGTTIELARGLMGISYVLWLAKSRTIAASYRERLKAILQQLDHAPTIAHGHIVTSLSGIGEGLWSLMTSRVNEARQYAVNYGDQKKLVESSIILEQLHYYHGEFEKAYNYADAIETGVTRSGNSLHLAWVYSAKAENALRLGRPLETLELARKAYDLYLHNNDYISEIANMGLLSLASARLNQPGEAAQWAQRVDQRLRKIGSPTSFYFLDAFVALAEQSVGKPEAAGILKRFRAFASVFPITEPRCLLHEGLHFWQSDKPERARKAWARGLRRAQELDMPYDQGLILLEGGLHSSGTERADQLRRAVEMFTSLGAELDLQRARLALEPGSDSSAEAV